MFEFQGLIGKVTVRAGDVAMIFERVLADGQEYRGVQLYHEQAVYYACDPYDALRDRFNQIVHPAESKNA